MPMPEGVVKLSTPTMAVQSDNEQIRVVTLPAEAIVSIVDGNINGTGFVKIRYMDQTLAMYAKDLRSQIDEDMNNAARFDEAG